MSKEKKVKKGKTGKADVVLKKVDEQGKNTEKELKKQLKLAKKLKKDSDKILSMAELVFKNVSALTLPAGSRAFVRFNSENGNLEFGIPVGDRGERGEQGIRGEKGERGAQGPVGPQGPMGAPDSRN